MIFASLPFLYIFLPGTLLGWHLLLRAPSSWRVWWLLLCSLAFYAYGNVAFLPLLLASITLNVCLGRWIRPGSRYATVLLGIGIAVHLLLLWFYKYANFFLDNVRYVHSEWSFEVDTVLLPLGISFFTFQHIAYLVDRSKGLAPASSWSVYALFISFFPQLIAGPIVHHAETMPQFKQANRSSHPTYIHMGLAFLSLGLFKKTVLADTFAPWVDSVFTASAPVDAMAAWLGTFSYAFQIYFDFSGYSDMALGAALLFGIRLPINFLSPYAAVSVTEFWRTWHITLGRWFRDYLYIPLGGNREGRGKALRNGIIVMALCGLWHGAAWGFVVWGLLHGMAIAVHRLWATTGRSVSRVPAQLLTFLFVAVAWVPFRAVDFGQTVALWRSMFFMGGTEDVISLPTMSIIWCIGAGVMCMFVPNSVRFLGYSTKGHLPAVRSRQMVVAAVALFLGTVPLLLYKETPFIYFGF